MPAISRRWPASLSRTGAKTIDAEQDSWQRHPTALVLCGQSRTRQPSEHCSGSNIGAMIDTLHHTDINSGNSMQ